MPKPPLATATYQYQVPVPAVYTLYPKNQIEYGIYLPSLPQGREVLRYLRTFDTDSNDDDDDDDDDDVDGSRVPCRHHRRILIVLGGCHDTTISSSVGATTVLRVIPLE